MSYAEEERERKQSKSVTLSEFTGVRNNVSTKRLGPTDFEVAKNIDIDDAKQVRRRRGYTLLEAGSFHSLWAGETATYGVKDGSIGIIRPDFSFAALQSGIGPTRVAYEQIGQEVFFSSATNSGIIQPDGTVEAWGSSNAAGTWLSPVVNPTSTLNPSFGKLLKAPPMATSITELNGRMFLADDTLLWATELYLYRLVDSTRTFFQFEAPITGIMSVVDGLYVGTETATYYMAGPLSAMKRTKITDVGVVPGSMVRVAAELVRPERNMSHMAVMFLTHNGVNVGLDGGTTYNITDNHVRLPEAVSAAAMFRMQDGINQYVSALDSAGTPTSTARVGDYVDAEIRRAADT